MNALGQGLWYANLAALAVLLARFAQTGIYRTYRFLFASFAVLATGSLAMMQIPFRSNAYGFAYIANETAVHLVTVFAVIEIYRIALEAHRGLADFGRASVAVAAGLALGVAAVVGVLDRTVPQGQSVILHRFFLAERSLDLIIVVFLLLIAVFVTWFPVEMSRNTALSISGFTLIYLGRAAGLLAANLLPRTYLAAVNDAFLGAETLVIVLWALAIRQEAPDQERVAGHFWNRDAFDRLTAQLNTINTALVRLGRG